MRSLRQPARWATSTVEFALVGSITFLMLIGLLVGSMGIFRYQEVAFLARESARYASVHGSQYASDTGLPAATPNDGNWSGGTGHCSLIHTNVIVPNSMALDSSKLTYSVTWNSSNSQFHTATVSGNTVNVANTVTVTVTYQWVPEAFLGGITLSSTSVYVMSY